MLETIFDHNVTPAEVEGVLGAELSKKEYLELVTGPDSALSALYRLFTLRGDSKKAGMYFEKIKSPALRASIIETNEGITSPPQ